MIGESPVERRVWLYRELYGLPCRISGIRIILSTNDVWAITAPRDMAARIDDALFQRKQVAPILDTGTPYPLILLAAPSPLDPSRFTTDLRLRSHCEFLSEGTQITLPSALPTPQPAPHWFRYPHTEKLPPITAVLRAIHIALRNLPTPPR
ncbi:hypothetical protein GPX89_32485 [Nocardia sp. ET3-3]|uniref:Uncharacterized protein n=1 Tax=Nocardia terrae TaxID=2675851 RepID=A0A7K1V5L4_9NOCA|nr:hypothetical protein [Nocardia terrae]MVU81943.1 hypothetical protein [Nocardia terrae]